MASKFVIILFKEEKCGQIVPIVNKLKQPIEKGRFSGQLLASRNEPIEKGLSCLILAKRTN